ncbi:hypothetical protein Peur_031965 [Populus x canadensis]
MDLIPLPVDENILERINDNAYKVDLPGDLSDVDQPRNTSKDPLHVPNGPMTRSKTKALKEALNALVLNFSTKSELKGPLEYQEETLVHLIHVQEGSNTTLFGP